MGILRGPALVAVSFFVASRLSAQAPAEPPPPEPPKAAEPAPWYQGIAVNGFVSAAYSYNFNSPDSGTNAYRVFDFDDTSFKIDVAEIVVQKAVSNAGDVGFRLDAAAGASIPRVSASSGLFRDSVTGQAEDFDLQQAYVSWIAPVGKGLRVDVGKFITHMGAEVIEGYDGYNDNYSRSILFGYAIPFTHTGIKVSYAATDQLSAMAMVYNGWDLVKDNNRGKSLGAQLNWTPTKAVLLSLNWCGGPERADSGAWRNMYDVVLTYQATDKLKFMLNFDYGRDHNAVGPNEDANWRGFAAYARYSLCDTFALAVRGEYFDDLDGVRTGVPQRLKEFTFTPEWKVGSHLVFRGDIRWDGSDEKTFQRGGTPAGDQVTAALNAIYLF